jgi:hypothetical protein
MSHSFLLWDVVWGAAGIIFGAVCIAFPRFLRRLSQNGAGAPGAVLTVTRMAGIFMLLMGVTSIFDI